MADESRAKREALAWWIRLSERSVTTDAIDSFFAWRRKPNNDAAYRAVEREAKERASRIL